MIIMVAMTVLLKGNDTSFISAMEWNLLALWAQFINSSLPMPPSQLCTDDFEGASPNNTNLALKGITALNLYAVLMDLVGQPNVASAYRTSATSHVKFWMEEAVDKSSSYLHYKRAFQLAEGASFSLKYNTLYGYITGLQTSSSWFPSSMMEQEFAFYANVVSQQYGVPLDDRHDFTLVEYLGDLLGVAWGMEQTSGDARYRQLITDQV